MRLRDVKQQARRQARAAIEEHEHLVATLDPEGLAEYTDEDGAVLCYVGTVFNMTPSGKYYLPWACSNVDPCTRCKGQGCDFCGGLGSREAWEYQVWSETFEEALRKRGYFGQNGEGDPCNIFVGRWTEAKEEVEA